MPDTTKPIEVSANAPVIDTLQAAGRYLVVITMTFPVILSVLKTRDIAAILEFVRSADAVAFGMAVLGLCTLGWGLYKTHKRSAQMKSVAADDRVPTAVASIKS